MSKNIVSDKKKKKIKSKSIKSININNQNYDFEILYNLEFKASKFCLAFLT